MSILFSHFLLKNNEIVPQEADFTEVLGSIAVTPKKLYFYGKMPENRLKLDPKTTRTSRTKGPNEIVMERPKVVAIVGTRRPTAYGTEIAYKLAYEAAKRGIVVISGLAYGIDSVAHRGALEAGGVTVAVLGTPIDQIYPRVHTGLAEEIVRTGGCVLSELAPGAEFHPKTSFLERNRLISGLADVVVIPEAAERSGSLNTAAHALEQGREVFAAPGDITKPLSRGCNRLIRQGAMPYLEPADVLDLLVPLPKPRRGRQTRLPLGDDAAETAILQALAQGVGDGEAILAQAGLDAAVFSRTLTILELKGRIRALGANQWTLC